MQVIKKDGRIEDFLPEKIATSVINAGADVRIQLSDKDGALVANEVYSLLRFLRGEDGRTSSYEIRGALNSILRDFGYHQVYVHYITKL